MCGIAGFTHIHKPLPPGVLTSALDGLDHRGPDHQGRFESSQVSLGATRLRIQDLEAGDQPLSSMDGDVTLLFNGEIFNAEELREKLSAREFQFQTRCDTEVVLNAFLCWGISAFAQLRGMFAIAVWVQSERRLLLVRDRMGIKPLYYRVQSGEIFFGSELKCLFAHPGVPRRICREALDSYLSLNYVPGPLTLVDGIFKLMPGQMLDSSSGRHRRIDYALPACTLPVPQSAAEACEQLDCLLSQAVREQLVSDRRVGLWLSGGLDSSAILHYAAQAQSKPVKTFSITFTGRSGDESARIRRLVSHFGTEHRQLDLNPSCDLEGAIEQLAYYSDEPSADAGALPTWFLAEMTSRHATVALSGEGSDELFAGYLTHKADRYSAPLRHLPRSLRTLASRCANRLPASDERIGFEYRLKRFLQGSLLTADAAHVHWNGTFSDNDKQYLLRYPQTGSLATLLGHMRGRGLQRYLDFDQRYYLPDDILYKVDRMSMAHSLEVRPPFLDPRVVDFANRLPADFKLRGTTSKYLLRRLMRDKLPKEILRGPKLGFDIPVHEWFRGTLRSFLLETLSRDAIDQTGLFHWAFIEELLEQHLSRKANFGYHLWGLMILLLWMKRWNIEFQPPEFESSRALAETVAVG